MLNAKRAGLNDSGEDGITRIVRSGVIHVSRGHQTTHHAHYAWKLHIGLDAPVWLRGAGRSIEPAAGARVVVVPPGVVHSTGAVGWSCAVFVAPGSRGTPWRSNAMAGALDGELAQRLVDCCKGLETQPRTSTADFITEVRQVATEVFAGPSSVDARAEQALQRLRLEPGATLASLAHEMGISLDRLSRLVTGSTGMPLRRHALWSRLLGLLSSNARYASITAAAADAGFADHAHMTRTYRSFLGRAPSEFRAPPDAIEPW